MDELKDVGAVIAALEKFKSALKDLKNTEKLDNNKTAISNAWKSSNADSFLGQYSNLITNITNACQNLEAYQGKIEAVVNEMTKFDETIIKS